ncbi:MAG TPA: hypothetical protein VG963_27785, partial [Polyangiaceae bacterium]|nr:hypothetical protein [Polyangiaceae bacterium]
MNDEQPQPHGGRLRSSSVPPEGSLAARLSSAALSSGELAAGGDVGELAVEPRIAEAPAPDPSALAASAVDPHALEAGAEEP